MISSLKHLPYESRLEKLKLWWLEDRCFRADLIKVFKIVHGLSSVSLETFFENSLSDYLTIPEDIHWNWIKEKDLTFDSISLVKE